MSSVSGSPDPLSDEESGRIGVGIQLLHGNRHVFAAVIDGVPEEVLEEFADAPLVGGDRTLEIRHQGRVGGIDSAQATSARSASSIRSRSATVRPYRASASRSSMSSSMRSIAHRVSSTASLSQSVSEQVEVALGDVERIARS